MKLEEMQLYKDYCGFMSYFYSIFDHLPVKIRFVGSRVIDDMLEAAALISFINRSRDNKAKAECISRIFLISDRIYVNIDFMVRNRIIKMGSCAVLVAKINEIHKQLGGLKKSLERGVPDSESPRT